MGLSSSGNVLRFTTIGEIGGDLESEIKSDKVSGNAERLVPRASEYASDVT